MGTIENRAPQGLSRRRALISTLAATGVTWTAPAVLSIDSAAAVSLICDTPGQNGLPAPGDFDLVLTNVASHTYAFTAAMATCGGDCGSVVVSLVVSNCATTGTVTCTGNLVDFGSCSPAPKDVTVSGTASGTCPDGSTFSCTFSADYTRPSTSNGCAGPKPDTLSPTNVMITACA
ncbi:MAG: hypothetical protein OEU32_16780 [Acidimicrobiia bacterium]|nr:hypothetical protein [Acidimicrobiia bacterium]